MDPNPSPQSPVDLAHTLILPVIEPAAAHYVVACNTTVGDPWKGLSPHLDAVTPPDLAAHLRHITLDFADIHSRAAVHTPPVYWETARCLGADPRDLRRARTAKRHLVVCVEGRAGHEIEHWWAALAIGRALQRKTRGVLLDVTVNRLLAPPWSGSGLDALSPASRHSLSAWTWVHYSPDRDGTFWMTVAGLERYGLPDLAIGSVPAASIRATGWLLMGLAHRLVDQQEAAIGHLNDPPALREVQRHWTITPTDVLGAHDAGTLPDLRFEDTTVCLQETANDRDGAAAMLEVVILS